MWLPNIMLGFAFALIDIVILSYLAAVYAPGIQALVFDVALFVQVVLLMTMFAMAIDLFNRRPRK